MFVGLCAGGGDKYFFRLWKSGNQQRTQHLSTIITVIISTITTENLYINHHRLIFSINHHHHLISTIIISIIILCTHHRDNPISIHIFEWMQLPTLPTSTSLFASTSYLMVAVTWRIHYCFSLKDIHNSRCTYRPHPSPRKELIYCRCASYFRGCVSYFRRCHPADGRATVDNLEVSTIA